MRIALVEGRNDDFDIVTEHAPLLAVERKAVKHRERIRGNGGAQPLDDVSIVVVVRWFDQHQRESLAHPLSGRPRTPSKRMEIIAAQYITRYFLFDFEKTAMSIPPSRPFATLMIRDIMK